MEIRNRVFEKYTDFEVKIPLNEGDRVLVKKGLIKPGEPFLHREESTLKKTINLPKILKCKEKECVKSITKIDGEYVEKGEVIAQKTSKGGLSMTEVKSPINGILELSKLEYGYVDILGEEKESVLESNFSGEVVGIDPIDGLVIKSNFVSLDAVVSSKREGRILGKLEVLGDGKSILKEDVLEEDYRGKIVWVGPYLYNLVAVELFERGALGVLTYAMSYEDFRNMGLPVMILGGFGSVHCDSMFLDKLLTFKDSYLILDSNENQIFFLKDSNVDNREWFLNTYINQLVISRSTSTYGYIGKVLANEQDSSNLVVDFGKRGTSVINMGLVDFIDL
jgi:hypothetical protein